MNFEQAKELSFLVPWKATECFSGPECWCRIIVPIAPPVQSKPAELTLDEKVDDLIDELIQENKVKAIKKLKRMLNERL